jgi:hypothetical protein
MRPYYSKKVKVGDIIDLYNSEQYTGPTQKDFRKISQIHEKDFFEKETDDMYRHFMSTNRVKGLEFLVERTAMEGGSTGGLQESPNGWHVTARQLNRDGTYNPRGNVITFYQSGDFNTMVEKVKVIGKMKMEFKRVE